MPRRRRSPPPNPGRRAAAGASAPALRTPGALAVALLSLLAAPTAPEAGLPAGPPAAERTPPLQEPEVRPISGRVVTGPDSTPVRGVEVSLHEIGPDGGGVLARDTTGPGGDFRFARPPVADPGAVVHLVTARYQGVPYVGRVLHSLAEPVEDYVLPVHPARPVGDISLTGRRTLVSAADGGLGVVEVLELENPSDSTLVPAGETSLGWELRLPPGAADVQPLATSLAETGADIRALGSALLVSGGIRPGGRQVAVRYRVPGAEVRVPVRGPATRHQVLLHPALEGEVTGLSRAGTVPFEDVSYRRWVGAGLEPGTVLRVIVSRGDASARRGWLPWLFLAIGVLALAGAIRSWRAADPPSRPLRGPGAAS